MLCFFALMPNLLGLIGQIALQAFHPQMHLLWTLFLSSLIQACLRIWLFFSLSFGQYGGIEIKPFLGTLHFRQPWFGIPQKEPTWILLMLGSPSPPAPPPTRAHWTAPPTGFFKINVDGATDVGGGNSCIGAGIQDSSGFPISALSLVLPSCFFAEITEAYALLHGVLFASEMQVHQALFESDTLSIIHDLTSEVSGSDFGTSLRTFG